MAWPGIIKSHLEDTTIEDVLKTFEGHYVKKQYEEALQFLLKHKGQISSELLDYNLGTVYAQLGNYPLSRYYLLMAEQKGFKTKQTYQNLKYIEEKLEVSRLEKPLTIQDYLIKTGLAVSDGFLLTLSLVVLIIGLVILKKKRSLLSISIFGLAVILPILLNLWINSWNQSIITKTTSLYSGPSAIFETSGEIPAGVRVLIKGDTEWKEILYPSRFHGWIKNSDFKRLE